MAQKKDNEIRVGCIDVEDIKMMDATDLGVFEELEDCYTIEQQRQERKKKEHKTTKRLMKR